MCIVHCETSSGVINDAAGVAEIFSSVPYFVDAMSSFGAVPLDLRNVDYVVSSANKCLEGVPGFAFAICRKSRLAECAGNSRSLSLDLHEQNIGLDKNGQFRFTPATHAMLAFRAALNEYKANGGLKGRQKRHTQEQ